MTKIDFDKPVPTPADVSEELRNLEARAAKLGDELRTIDAEQLRLQRSISAAKFEDDRKVQIDALIKGSAYEPPADIRDQISACAKRRVLVQEAIDEISTLIRAEREAASRRIADEFQPEQKALAREYYGYLAKAIAVHAKLGKMKHRIERAGVNSASLHDFGRELLGVPGKRDDDAAYAMRDGVRRGHIAERDVPAGYL